MKDKMINIVDAALKMEFDFVPLQKSIEMTEMLMQAEVRPIVHGSWNTKGHAIICDVCNHPYFYQATKFPRYRYCPNCGAKMDLGED